MSQARSVIVVKEGFNHQVGPADKRREYKVGDEFEVTEVVGWPAGTFENRLKHGFIGFKTTLVDALTSQSGAEPSKSVKTMTKADLILYAKDTLGVELDANLSLAALRENVEKLERDAAGG